MPRDASTRLLAILSGGIGSAVALAMAGDLLKPTKVGAIHFDYGQRQAIPEAAAFRKLCEHFAIAEEDRYTRTLAPIGDNSLTEIEGAPNRNMRFITYATTIAIPCGYDALCIGIYKGGTDRLDNSSTFVNRMKRALSLSPTNKLSLYAPVVKMSIAAILRAGITLNMPLGAMWSCTNPTWFEADESSYVACGECASCKLRLAAFKTNGITDSVLYLADLAAKEE